MLAWSQEQGMFTAQERNKNERKHCLKGAVDQAVDEILKGNGTSKWERDEISRKKSRSGNVN